MTRRHVPLTHDRLIRAAVELGSSDPVIETMVAADGPPPLWGRPAGFATLIRIILEQQVSLASGAAAYARLSAALGRVTPRLVLGRTHRQLCGLGLTRQKARYCTELASAINTGDVDLARLDVTRPDAVREELMQVPGIGRWTADVYLIMAMRHPDVWPRGDVALYRIMRRSWAGNAETDELDTHAERWRPWRSVAARILWHHYLRTRRRLAARRG